jgi:hypothetical protein
MAARTFRAIGVPPRSHRSNGRKAKTWFSLGKKSKFGRGGLLAFSMRSADRVTRTVRPRERVVVSGVTTASISIGVIRWPRSMANPEAR